MITFAHGCFGLWQKQSNQKGLTPAIGASPDFSFPAQKSFIGRNKNFCNTNKKTEILASLSVYDLTKKFAHLLSSFRKIMVNLLNKWHYHYAMRDFAIKIIY